MIISFTVIGGYSLNRLLKLSTRIVKIQMDSEKSINLFVTEKRISYLMIYRKSILKMNLQISFQYYYYYYYYYYYAIYKLLIFSIWIIFPDFC